MEIAKGMQFPTKKSQGLRNRKSKESESGLDRVGDEIWVEIISKLPCKIATQCKCVCKRWLALISDYHYFSSRFLQHHHNKSESPSSSLTTLFPSLRLSKFINLFSNNNITSLDIDTFRHLNFIPKFKINRNINRKRKRRKSEGDFIHVLAKYRDLVLLCHDKNEHCFHDVYYVCNPHTNQCLSLPPYPFTPTLPLTELVLVGFISCSEGLIKVLRLDLLSMSDSNFYSYKVNIFSSDIGEWRELINSNLNQLLNLNPIPRPTRYRNPDLVPFYLPIPGLTHSVACNGTIFFRDHFRRLIGFNVVDYRFHSIDLPPFPFIHRAGIMDMGVCRGCLRICQWIYHPSDFQVHPHICIWELELLHAQDFTNISWSLVHKLYPKDLIPTNFIPLKVLNDLQFRGSKLNAIDFHPNDGDVVYFYWYPHCIFSCNLLSKTLGLLLTFKMDADYFEFSDSYSPPPPIVNVNVINQPYSRWSESEPETRSVLPPHNFGPEYCKDYWIGGAYFLDHLLWPTQLPKVLQRRSRKRPSSSSSTNSSLYMQYIILNYFDKQGKLINFKYILFYKDY